LKSSEQTALITVEKTLNVARSGSSKREREKTSVDLRLKNSSVAGQMNNRKRGSKAELGITPRKTEHSFPKQKAIEREERDIVPRICSIVLYPLFCSLSRFIGSTDSVK
jgi:hypothetical protein